MKNNKKKIASLLAVFILLFSYISLTFSSIDVYASSNSFDSRTLTFSSSSSTKSTTNSLSSPSNTKSDSGSFTTTPNSNSSTNSNTNTIKPDSGDFSTTSPGSSGSSSGSGSTSSGSDYGGQSSRPVFNTGGMFSGYDPFYRFTYGVSVSSWIIRLVGIITALIVIYIVIDIIRSRRD